MKRNTPKFLNAHRDTTTEHEIPKMLSPQAKTAAELKLHASARRCSHYLSDMTASAPQTFLRFPYRPSILTLLKQLQTTPSDSQAARRASKPPTVYAAFQQHWNPEFNFPVLTLVASCDSRIHSVSYERSRWHEMSISFSVKGDHEDHTSRFYIPLPAIAQSDEIVKMDLQHAYEHENIFLKYIVYTTSPTRPLLTLNVHNLNLHSCDVLHIQSVLHPRDNTAFMERYILGLSGCRTRHYQTVYLHKTHCKMQLLDTFDLFNIGYYADQDPTKPPAKRARFSESETIIRHRSILYLPPDRFPKTCPNYTKWNFPRNYDLLIPQKYPPPASQRYTSDLFRRHMPRLFPQGYFRNRILAYPPSTTVQEAIDIYRNTFLPLGHIPEDTIVSEFGHYHYVKPWQKTLELRSMPFARFLDIHCAISNPTGNIKLVPAYATLTSYPRWMKEAEHPTFEEMDAIDQTDFATAFLSDSDTSSEADTSDNHPIDYAKTNINDDDATAVDEDISNTINPLRLVDYSDSPPDNSEWERNL